MLLGALELAAAAAQHPEREQRGRLARHVTGVTRDLERLAEVLLRQVPLTQAVADEAQVLVVGPHPGVEAGALVEPQGLLQEPGRLAPLAQVLVHQPEVVEGGDEPVDVVDAAEGGGAALEPLDRLRIAPQPGAAQAADHRGAPDRPVVVTVAQNAIGVERVAAAAAVFAAVG